MLADAPRVVEYETVIQRIQEKGGWSYVMLPPDVAAPLATKGWMLTVSGTVDDYAVNHVTLYTVKNEFFFPLKKEIREAIGKQEGDTVRLRLWLETNPLPLPADMAEALDVSPEARQFYDSLSIAHQRYYLNWIAHAKHSATRERRIVEAVIRLERCLKFGEKGDGKQPY